MSRIPTSGPTPVALAWHEVQRLRGGINLPRPSVHDLLLRLKRASGVALVVYADHPVPELEFAAAGGCREGPVHDQPPLAVDGAAEIDLWSAGDGGDGVAGVELDDLLVSQFECCEEVLDDPLVEEGL